jgi:trimeric autotransporter adhesin
VVVTVTVMKDPITGITALPVIVGAGAEWRMIEKAPNGIVTSAELSIVSDNSPATWIDTKGGKVGRTEELIVTKPCGSVNGVTVVESRGIGFAGFDTVSAARAASSVVSTLVTIVVSMLIVTISGTTADGSAEARTDVAKDVSNAASAGMLDDRAAVVDPDASKVNSDAASGDMLDDVLDDMLDDTLLTSTVDIWSVRVAPAGTDGLAINCSAKVEPATSSAVLSANARAVGVTSEEVEIAIDSMVGTARDLITDGSLVESGISTGTTTVLLCCKVISIVRTFSILLELSSDWAAGTGAMLWVICRIDVVVVLEHGSDVELSGAATGFEAAISVDCAVLASEADEGTVPSTAALVGTVEDWAAGSTAELTVTEVDDWAAGSTVGMIAPDEEDWAAESTIELTTTELDDWAATSAAELAATEVGGCAAGSMAELIAAGSTVELAVADEEDWAAVSTVGLAATASEDWAAASMMELAAAFTVELAAASTVELAVTDASDCVAASTKELSMASKEVLPAPPTPTAGTLPTCPDLVAVGASAAAWTWSLTGSVVTAMSAEEVELDTASDADAVESALRSSRSEVFPVPTPTAGTFPSSLPSEAAAASVASGCVGVTETATAPVCLARTRWKEMGFELGMALKRFMGAPALRTTSWFLRGKRND